MKRRADICQLCSMVEGIIEGYPEIGLVYLFGSRVENIQGPMSDYDFGIYIDKREASEYETRAFFSHALALKLQTEPIDVVVLNRAPVELAFNVISRGEILFERDVCTRVEFESRIMGMYCDYLPVLRSARREILEGNDHETRVRRYRKTLGRTQRTLGQIRAAKG